MVDTSVLGAALLVGLQMNNEKRDAALLTFKKSGCYEAFKTWIKEREESGHYYTAIEGIPLACFEAGWVARERQKP